MPENRCTWTRLSDLVASYEDEHHVIGPASDADMLRHLMEAKGVSQADLSRAVRDLQVHRLRGARWQEAL